jgi:uncharacterized protein YdeI (YjbR/CyaY-like superfamily)
VRCGLNKKYIQELLAINLMQKNGLKIIKIEKQNGSWSALDGLEKASIPKELQQKFDKNKTTFINYQNFTPNYRKRLSLLAECTKNRNYKKKPNYRNNSVV